MEGKAKGRRESHRLMGHGSATEGVTMHKNRPIKEAKQAHKGKMKGTGKKKLRCQSKMTYMRTADNSRSTDPGNRQAKVETPRKIGRAKKRGGKWEPQSSDKKADIG